MDVLKAAGLSGVALAVILTACSRAPIPTPIPPSPKLGPPPDRLVLDPRLLNSPLTTMVILVRVVDVRTLGPESPESATDPMLKYWKGPVAKMLVLKSWKGEFSAGRVLRTPTGYIQCATRVDLCGTYYFGPEDKGQEFLIMNAGGITRPDGTKSPDVIDVPLEWVWPTAKSQALIAALDQGVAGRAPPQRMPAPPVRSTP